MHSAAPPSTRLNFHLHYRLFASRNTFFRFGWMLLHFVGVRVYISSQGFSQLWRVHWTSQTSSYTGQLGRLYLHLNSANHCTFEFTYHYDYELSSVSNNPKLLPSFLFRFCWSTGTRTESKEILFSTSTLLDVLSSQATLFKRRLVQWRWGESTVQSGNERLTMKFNSKTQSALTERNFTPSVGAKAIRSCERIVNMVRRW